LATKNRPQQNRRPQLATVQLLDEQGAAPSTYVESSVDLYIVVDDHCSSVGTSPPAGERLVDASVESPREKEHNYYKVLFESTVDGLFIVDAEMMRIVLANETAAKMYGFESADDMIGVNPLKLVHPDDKDRALRIIAEDVIRNDLRLIHRFRAVKRDGREMWARVVGTRTEYQGKLAGLISIRDVSDRVQAEDEKQSVQQRLAFEGRLASMGELAAGLAHELNDPVVAVLNYARLLASRRDLDETLRSGLDAIDRAAQRAVTITDNLLQLERRHKPEMTLVSINEVLEKALRTCAPQLEAGKVELSVDATPDLPLIMADFEQIKQVFVNIIENAEHAMLEAHGQGTLRIGTQHVGEMVRISFTDNGAGIPEEDLARVFDPFFTTKGTGKGTGLGLTVAYGLVEGHGGRIYAASDPGKETTLTVELPVVPADEPAPCEPDQAPAYRQ
jgi:PAS domain S-box-containing protein